MTFKGFKFFSFLILTPFIFQCSSAQSNWKDTLKEVKIKGKKTENSTADQRKDFTAGQHKMEIDSTILHFYQHQSLSKVIEDQSPAFIKSYGVNGISTMSIRGASAAQSAVFWNGIPISNPSSGLADLSLMQVGLFQKISLLYGSSGSLYGSGNIGGALLLEKDPAIFQKNYSWKASLEAGSFGHHALLAQGAWQNKRWNWKATIYEHQSKNNFNYIDAKNEEQTMNNALSQSKGVLISADLNLDTIQWSKHLINFQIWHQDFYREIPPALFESFSVKNQTDRSLKSLLHWQKKLNKTQLYTKFSVNKDWMNYSDGIVLPNNQNEMTQVYMETGWTQKLNETVIKDKRPLQHQLYFFTPIQYLKSYNLQNQLKNQEWRPALVGVYKLSSALETFALNISSRLQWGENQKYMFLPGMNIAYQFIDKELTEKQLLKMTIRGNIQKSYRLPSLNELYFSPGGNPDLKAERGWAQDGGYLIKYVYQNFQNQPLKITIEQESNIFNRHIQDWIYWLGGAIWTPHNIAKVRSRGLETFNAFSISKGKWIFNSAFKSAYVLSTTEETYMPNDGSISKQIPYTPRYNYRINAGIEYGNIQLNYNWQKTSYRFITVDESQYLKPYQLSNIQIAYKHFIKNIEFTFTGQIMNFMNEDYQIVNGRPMPKRHYLIGLQMRKS